MAPFLPHDAPTEDAVRRANREVYNSKSPQEYDRNESIFGEGQERRLRTLLEEVRGRCGAERFLDLGCGTGNLLRIARQVFPEAIGVDQAERLLMQVARREEGWPLAAAQAHRLPFADRSFDGVGMYALLHHVIDPLPVLAEAHRVLRPGGILYTDHDPNRFFFRFYHPYFRWKRRHGAGFGSEAEDLAEFHHVYTSGLDPEGLADGLRRIGFGEVEVRYRCSTNHDLGGIEGRALALLRGAARLLPLRSLHTHFILMAVKQGSPRL